MANTSSIVIISVVLVLSIMHSSNSQTTQPSTTPTIEFQNCIDNCLTTPQFNPVCGTNGITYYNEYKLKCAQRCGLSVQMRRMGACMSSAGGK